MVRSNFRVLEGKADDERIVLKDVGHDNGYMSVTNDIDRIVETFDRNGFLRGRRLFYYDSEGDLVEAIHNHGKFMEYVPGDFFERIKD